MPLIKWLPAHSVGIEEMDKQHQELINLINQLHAAMTTGQGSDAVGDTLSRIIDYTKTHFASEEALMQSFRFPQIASHKSEHQKLTEQVLDLERRFQLGQPLSAHEVLQFLREWLPEHIQGSDRKYGNYINAIARKNRGVPSLTA